MLDFMTVVLAFAGLICLNFIYNVFLHRLRSYPGPWYCSISRLWFIVRVFQGEAHFHIKKLHDTYGDVVRIAPDELSYIAPEAWPAMKGHSSQRNLDTMKNNGAVRLERDAVIVNTMFADLHMLLNAEGVEHRKEKRMVVQPFSKKGIMVQETVLLSHVKNTVQSVAALVTPQKWTTLDAYPFMANAVFDVIAWLTFSGDMGAKKMSPMLHPKLAVVKKTFYSIQYFAEIRRLPKAILYLLEVGLGKTAGNMVKGLDLVKDDVRQRLGNDHKQDDFVSYMSSHLDVSEESDYLKVVNNSNMLNLAAPDGTPGTITATMYHLLANTSTYHRALNEVRTRFRSGEDLTIANSEELVYLDACIRESLRLNPAVLNAMPYHVPSTGTTICGQFVPGNVVVGINNWAACRSEANFKDAANFLPQRWLESPDSEFSSDRQKVAQPFGYGSRGCVGKELALAFARLVLASLLLEFDMRLGPNQDNWDLQKGYFVPDRQPLLIEFTTRGSLECTS